MELTPVVTYLINTIVSNGTPPPTWLKVLVTPVHKKTPPTEFFHLRPISVKPVLCRLTERLIVRKHLLPACHIPSDQLTDQFAYRPSEFIRPTAALIATTHHISRLLESCSYVRCILIDYSKAFDTINHSILFRKLLKLPIPSNILLWISNFLTDRMQAVFFRSDRPLLGYLLPKVSFKGLALVRVFT